jgi:hypothetical protein
MLIASHALSLGVTLVTNNIREFSRIPTLSLENWIGRGGTMPTLDCYCIISAVFFLSNLRINTPKGGKHKSSE